MEASKPYLIYFKTNTFYVFALFLCTVLLFSCTKRLKGTSDKFQNKLEKIQPISTNSKNNLSAKIIFLNYSIVKKDNGNKETELISKIITEGKIKKNSNKFIKKGNIGDLQCTQMDNSKTPINNVFIKNPLSKIIEYINEDNALEKRKIETNKTPFSIRLQLDPRTKFIVINQITTPTKTMHHLITTQL